MKTVYFVRHGETEGNTGKIFQGSDTPLNERGFEQARVVAERCAKLPVQALLASSMKRAQQTAEVIGKRIGLPIESSDLFAEAKRPTTLMGRSRDDKDAYKMELAWIKGYLGEGPKVEDGEHFDELIRRAGAALDYVEQHSAEHILVVTHGLFLKELYARLVFGGSVTSEEFKKIVFSLRSDNTGITVFTRDESIEKPGIHWVMRVWNDHAHCG